APPSVQTYLTNNWLAPHIRMMWSAVYRAGRSVHELNDTNMLIEAWHHVLKGKFLEHKRNRRADLLIYTLLRRVIPHYALRLRRQTLRFDGPDLIERERSVIVERA
ncbi:hypothetical protein K474DRAFT_1581603, partial [Panus rudis PR-1116 ss-1]